jgi:hypothetical protein
MPSLYFNLSKNLQKKRRPLKRLLDVRDWNGSTSGPTPC